MKYSQWIGILAAITLVIACFIPWAYYPDVQKDFTGFFSENNQYGRPGKFFIAFAVLAIVFFLLPKIWAKRWNLLINAIIVAWAIRCYLVFSACYNGICPDKKSGLWLVVGSAFVMLLMAVFPDTKLPQQKKNG
ncbi:hypothetical protein HHL16_15585 [Pseudoflavitalea sp. G-6-1-2]|uniref:hypothetical protein n=1 Tax=Pseudoflavitalea sp. G-6-1-2 TaxID=2728841 RepID=UPI00146D0912|nr:hypothetical protein [Pseudoflavitalea sp. G-6-1-2]NML22305.1 hypothetical protein [Pseudoflavitalea sp. G-6-1-2]